MSVIKYEELRVARQILKNRLDFEPKSMTYEFDGQRYSDREIEEIAKEITLVSTLSELLKVKGGEKEIDLHSFFKRGY